ncbi:MAG: metallophosphoesterase [Candidatus Heimdallarchaeota archaeon]|nr:MAG: metallophosphoesterase [Candidatus Heimdallarchaeota archaeon]
MSPKKKKSRTKPPPVPDLVDSGSPPLEEVIVFSDSHISKFTGLFHKKAFNTGVKMINARLKANPNALLLHLGDITDSGTYEDFIFSKKLLDKSFPNNSNFYTIPGNHDMRNIGDTLWKDFYGERQFLIDTSKDGGNMIILGIDSSEPDENIGRIGDRGIEAILELQSYPDDLVKVLCFHHHLLPIPNTGRERSMILDAGDVMQIVWDAGIDVIITAHRHYPNAFSLSNGTRRCLLVNSGTFSSFKTRGKAGHTFVDLILKEEDVNVKFFGIEEYSKFQTPVIETQTMRKGEIQTEATGVIPGESLLSKICQFSDTHFTSGGDFLAEVYDTGIRLMIQEQPNVLVHCGDLTNDAFPEDFAVAKMKLRELRSYNIPYVIVPGPRDLQPFGRELWVQQVGPLDPIYEDPSLRILGINTGSEQSGHVGRSRMKMIQHEFEAFGSYKFFLVLMHHSALPIPRARFKRAVTDAGDVIDFVTHRKVPLVLSGLDHYATTMQIEDTIFVNAGTFSSKKIRSKRLNTYNVISIYESGILKIEEVEIHSTNRHLLGTYRVPIAS